MEPLAKTRARLRASRAQRRRELRALYRHAGPAPTDHSDLSALILLALVACIVAIMLGHAVGEAQTRAPLICKSAAGRLVACDRDGALQ